jgi:hypothetical protein
VDRRNPGLLLSRPIGASVKSGVIAKRDLLMQSEATFLTQERAK